MSTLELAQEKLQGGYFRDALELLRERRPPRPPARWLSVEAETLERTGCVREALEAAETVSLEATDPVATAQALLVLGVIAREQGRAAYSVGCLRSAYDVARACDARGLAARALSRLLLSEFEDQPDFDVDDKLRACSVEVQRWADAATAAALQAFASEAYAKRGRLTQARRCLSVAECGATAGNNPWLSGLVAIARFCVSYLEMDLESAEESAVEALRQAQVSGHVRTELAAIINLAHVWMHRRRYDDAERAFRRALAMCDISARVRDYTTEGLARLQLLRGDYQASGRLMDEVATVEQECGDSYSRTWGLVTRSEVFLQSGNLRECEELCKEGLERAERVGGSSLVMQLNAILADCYMQQSRVELAEVALAKAREAMGGSPLGVIAVMSSRMARTLECMGFARDAEVLRRRVARIESRAKRPVSTRAPGMSRPDASSHAVTEAWGRAIDRIVAICEQVTDTHLIVAEIVEALQEAGCCAGWSLLDRKSGTLISGWAMKQGLVQVLSLPGDNDVELAVDPGPGRYAQRIVAGLGQIILSVNGANHPGRAPKERTATPPSGMTGVVELAKRAAESDVPVLLLGETGVGKEWLARQIHSWSKRNRHRFIGFNCSAVPKDMLDAQLFGHRKGAFTGAHESSIGVVRAASGGTLLLDEVGELSPELQVKLLRFLEGREVHPIGESVPVSVDVRVLAATNAEPTELIRQGALRQDLFYRLNVITIRIPPLRERREEILPLAEHFLAEACEKAGRRLASLSRDVKEVFLHYSWPGNVRQLANEVQRGVALMRDSEEISVDTLSEEVRQKPRMSDRDTHSTVTVLLDQRLQHATNMVERAAIVRALEVAGGRRDSAAALLGVSRKGLYLKCRRHGLDLSQQVDTSGALRVSEVAK